MHNLKYRVITITGEVCTGKSSLAVALLEELAGWERLYTGQLFRDFLEGKGKSIQEVSLLPDEIHREFDQIQKTLITDKQNIIAEGRMAGWLAQGINDVYKVYCTAKSEVRVERYMRREKCDVEQARSEILFRDEEDVKKYQKVYGIEDYRNPDFYDLIIDTSYNTPVELAQKVLKAMNTA